MSFILVRLHSGANRIIYNNNNTMNDVISFGPIGPGNWAEPLPIFDHRARPSRLSCTNEYLVLAPEEETAVQAVVGSIVWAFHSAS